MGWKKNKQFRNKKKLDREYNETLAWEKIKAKLLKEQSERLKEIENKQKNEEEE